MDLTGMRSVATDWINTGQDSVRWQAHMYTVMNVWVP
jgi:hypothetical protein